MHAASSAHAPLDATHRTAQTSFSATDRAHAALANYQILRRTGTVVAFEPQKIAVAITKAFLVLPTCTRLSSKSAMSE